MHDIVTHTLRDEISTLKRGFVAAVRERAAERPDAPAMTFLDHETDWEGRTIRLTRGELDTRATAMAAQLQKLARPGDRVAILCPNGPEYVAAFLACLYAGLLPVPLLPPELQRRTERLAPTLEDCSPVVAVTLTAYRASVEAVLAAVGGATSDAHVVLADQVSDEHADAFTPIEPDLSATAYLQYTSGSTRRPGGVEVTHRNIAVAVAQHVDRQGVDEHSVIVSWLPFFHDMGLVFALIMPLAVGVPAVQMTPHAFIQQPLRWLRLFGEYRGTHTMIPNFGLDVCVDAVPVRDRDGVDLSSVRYVGNASEPVRAQSLARFTEAYAPHGFRHAAHSPCWGLAESTLIVTGIGVADEPLVEGFDREALAEGRIEPCAVTAPAARLLVGCGPAFQAQDVRVVDPGTGLEAAAGEVGELLVRGGSVCHGYWERAGSGETFGRSLDGTSDWMRTGDLGFFHSGELFIAGRAKDVIIVDGRNHHAIDIEVTVEQISPAVRRGHVAAFPVETGDRELAVVVVELRPEAETTVDLEDLRTAIRAAVADAHDITLYDVALVTRGTIPKTSSGKLRRRICRTMYTDGELAAQTVAADRTAP
ncbi:fatty acyl-AMP ligase [Streptomyces sp. YU58]|uniref:fatty acyl-AMP ligase n=1 Tax=Streptomyces sp. SX92 TaxID=3158972 RepID=UPI0027BA1536|nr:fatty acyl-AMP ligase [Streptomyces coralus]WLW50154.1 fatty acyl-AMP ligase [Streptomyces coralus]